MERKNAWVAHSTLSEERERFAEAYKAFLDRGKTERECVGEGLRLAAERGFRGLSELTQNGRVLQPGDRISCPWMKKSLMLFIVGKQPIEKGMNILGAHIDSPRLDVKQIPLYEDHGLAYLDTHYYGGIKKYQWLALPLAIHGVIVKKDGTCTQVTIGEDETDPVFCITDLLPHLAKDQMEKNASKFVEGEALNLLIASQPDEKEEKDAVLARIRGILTEKYQIEEEDFLSSELEIVPAGHARDMGLDRSMIIGYGHDDRCCAYPSLAAILDFEGVPEYTLCCILTDKEEIGSIGATGMASRYFENLTAELLAAAGEYREISLRRTLANSRMLSSDVSAGYDPEFASAFEAKNSAYLGKGICFNKFTGSRGKAGSSDANAEFVAEIRRIMDEADVCFQMSELGRVDQGGGGTIAYLCAKYGMNVIDCGVPVLSMHAPWEVLSKADLYEGYRCYCAFLRGARELTDRE